jgi:hypothetical protein
MLTVIESPLFTKLWPKYWSEEEEGNSRCLLLTRRESAM